MTLLERAMAMLGKSKKSKKDGVQKAKKALKGRESRIDAQLKAALGRKPKKKKLAVPAK
jgi:hypothetical protein